MSTRNPMVRLPQDEGSESGVELLDVNDDEPEGGDVRDRKHVRFD